MMTVGDVRRKIAELSREHREATRYHQVEAMAEVTALADDLYIEVLEAIAGGAMNSEALAREVLKTRKFPFSRHYV